ncbi:hypothetical protein K1T71_004247 [Dendrolimus kikuchii]|uniref:Uncharacterized protein n=1 Tax=Dendrolimus kikuchii TaxID=765133 RepID=A0ACC1D6R9_9NEOP|nr:hypothetical protein K1T71_004247 [Dendrolimus kikuchii]
MSYSSFQELLLILKPKLTRQNTVMRSCPAPLRTRFKRASHAQVGIEKAVTSLPLEIYIGACFASIMLSEFQLGEIPLHMLLHTCMVLDVVQIIPISDTFQSGFRFGPYYTGTQMDVTMPYILPNTSMQVLMNVSDIWDVPPIDLDVFHRPDVLVITLYVAVLTASLSANTLLIFIVIKFQYMRR